MKKLQNKIFMFFACLLLLLQSIIFFTNYHTTKQQEQQQIESLLTSAVNNFENQFQQRSYYLAAFSDIAAKDFGLKQVFEEDTRSLLVALNNHRKRIDADMVMAVKADGTVIGQLLNRLEDSDHYKITVGAEQGLAFRFMKWFELATNSHIYEVDGEIYQISFSPIKSGLLTIGWVGFGYVIDQRLASKFAELTGLTTAFALKESNNKWRLFASSQQQQQHHDQIFINDIIAGSPRHDVIATTYPVGATNDRELVVVLYGVRSDLLMSIQQRWQELLLLTAFSLLISLAGAYWIAANISRPVKILVEQVKDIIGGNYSRALHFTSKDELGQLAQEFNHMKRAINKREQTIYHQAFHDQLTGLPNRYQLIATIEQWVNSDPQPFAVVRFSPQRMKEVNYSLGHDVGDEVLKEIASRLIDCSESEVVFNVGGSSFALVIKNINKVKLQSFLDEIEQAMGCEFKLKGMLLNVQIHAGVSLYPEHSNNIEKLLSMAGTALQHGQKNSLPQVIFESNLSLVTIERLQLINGLKSAIDGNQLVLFYQPKLDLKTGVITEVEALVRWNHPEHGMVPPDKFICLAEQTGYIHQLTAWVLDTALKQYNLWQQQNIQLAIAVNFSAENLKFPNFYEQVINALERHSLTPAAICIEITESVVVDNPEMTINLLSRFKKQGFRLSIDDYGTGYSSLAQLTQLPVCEMKIDKAFITNLLKNKEDKVIVNSTIELAHALNLGVVAEGIEDEATLEWLEHHGCDMAQGYYICKPQPVDKFNDWLLQSKYFEPNFDLVRIAHEKNNNY